MRILPAAAVRERTTFIGRARELSLLVGDLEKGHGLLTITGPSGIGKTRLARQVGSALEGAFAGEGGAWFCNLASCSTSAEVESAVARMLDVPQAFGSSLEDAIANRGRMLLILDNLDSAATQVGPLLGGWLDRCPELQLLTTSISIVEVDGAVRYELGPLEAEDAIALYLERAHRAWAGNEVHEMDPEAVEELVSRLDRAPLAIELAAARVRVLPPKALLSRFADRFELLRSAKPGRHGSLLGAIRLTWELLSEREQRGLAAASVFEDGFDLEAARAVLAPEASEVEVLDLLDELRSKALLHLEDSEPPRFRLFESVRDFAARELRGSGLEPEALRRHADHFLSRAEELVPAVEGTRALEILRWFQAERENLVAVLERNLEANPAFAARAGIVLEEQIKREGYLVTGVKLLERAVEAARKCGDRRLLLHALISHCSSAVATGRTEVADAILEEGLAIARELGAREEEGKLLITAGWRHLVAGDLDRAASIFDEAIAIAEEESLPILHATALMNRGEVAHSRLAMAEAEAYCSRALEILRRHDYPLREGRARIWIGLIWANQGRFEEAREALRTAIRGSRESGHKRYEVNALMNLGGVELLAGALDEAEACSRAALEIQRALGDRRGEAVSLGNLGNIHLERGALEQAERFLLQSLAYFESCGDRRMQAAVLPFLAVAEARQGRLESARGRLEEARDYFAAVGDETSRSITELLEGSLEIAEASRYATTREAQVLVRRARARLAEARARSERPAGGMFEAIRLLEADLASWDGRNLGSPPRKVESILVGPEAAWFELPGQEPVDLRKRVAIRRMFHALVTSRLQSPGVGISSHLLFEVGWPRERVDPEVALRRVYLGVWTLRGMGLSEVLINEGSGYLLDPEVPLELREA